MANKKEEILREAKSGNSGLDVYLENSEKERIGEKINRTSCLAAAGATLMPLASTKVVVLGQENFLTLVVNFFNILRELFGGVL